MAHAHPPTPARPATAPRIAPSVSPGLDLGALLPGDDPMEWPGELAALERGVAEAFQGLGRVLAQGDAARG